MTFDEKLIKLKQIHARSHPDALSYIKQWESRFAQLQVTKDWLQHPITQKLRELATEQIDRIVSVLANSKDLAEADRKAMFEQKEAHLIYLTLLTEDPTSEIKSIESKVDAEL